ncbi:MAG: chemotaxis protein CheC [Desulfamplus sp.]|nr:chemotaxis protein CheC [Desulfamplus sp.]
MTDKIEDDKLDERSFDIIKEVINMGLGEAADALSQLVNARVIIKVPDVHIMDIKKAKTYIKNEVENLGIYIAQDFTGIIEGKTLLFYTQECGISLLNTIYGDKKKVQGITETGISTLNEIGNIIMVSYISAISNFIDGKIKFSIPNVSLEVSTLYFENLLNEMEELDKAIVVKNEMSIKSENIQGYLFVLLSFKNFLVVVKNLQKRVLGK